MKEQAENNFLDYVPCRLRDFEFLDDGLVEVHVPRFGRHRVGRTIQRALKLSDFKIRLDRFGSFVWQRCDGERSLFSIGREMKEHFGEEIEPVYERLVFFVRQMMKGKLIEVKRHES